MSSIFSCTTLHFRLLNVSVLKYNPFIADIKNRHTVCCNQYILICQLTQRFYHSPGPLSPSIVSSSSGSSHTNPAQENSVYFLVQTHMQTIGLIFLCRIFRIFPVPSFSFIDRKPSATNIAAFCISMIPHTNQSQNNLN